MPSLYLATPEEVKVLLAAINSNKAVGFENIPPNLIKQATYTLAGLVSNSINNAILIVVLPRQVKCLFVSPLGKTGWDKISVLNYRPISILTTFSKIYEQFIKEYIISSMNKFPHRISLQPEHIVLSR